MFKKVKPNNTIGTPEIKMSIQGKTIIISSNRITIQVNELNLHCIQYQMGVLSQSKKDIIWMENNVYDFGTTPSIALHKDITLIEAHKSQNTDKLWYNIGTINVSKGIITWKDSLSYDIGTTPSIAVDKNGIVVAVHLSRLVTNNLYYKIGHLSSSTDFIHWGKTHKYDTGVNPSVAISQNGKIIVEVHKSGILDELWYNVGKLNIETGTIDWKSKSCLDNSARQYDEGTMPSVFFLDDHTVYEIHKSKTGEILWGTPGIINLSNGTIDWIKSKRYGMSLPATNIVSDKTKFLCDQLKQIYSTHQQLKHPVTPNKQQITFKK